GRVEQRRGDLQQGGLARAVRADDDPPLVLMNGPVDASQQSRAVPANGDVLEAQHLTAHPRSPLVSNPACRSPVKLARLLSRWLQPIVAVTRIVDRCAIHRSRRRWSPGGTPGSAGTSASTRPPTASNGRVGRSSSPPWTCRPVPGTAPRPPAAPPT